MSLWIGTDKTGDKDKLYTMPYLPGLSELFKKNLYPVHIYLFLTSRYHLMLPGPQNVSTNAVMIMSPSPIPATCCSSCPMMSRVKSWATVLQRQTLRSLKHWMVCLFVCCPVVCQWIKSNLLGNPKLLIITISIACFHPLSLWPVSESEDRSKEASDGSSVVRLWLPMPQLFPGNTLSFQIYTVSMLIVECF